MSRGKIIYLLTVAVVATAFEFYFWSDRVVVIHGSLTRVEDGIYELQKNRKKIRFFEQRISALERRREISVDESTSTESAHPLTSCNK